MNPLLALLPQAAPPAASETGVRETLRLLDLPEPWVVVLVLLPACALVAWLAYGRETLPLAWRGLLMGLRFAALAFLLVVIFRPVFVQRREEIKPAEVVILADDSASMRRRDAYAADGEERGRLAQATGLQPASATRLDLARAALERSLLPQLADGDYASRVFRFADGVSPAPEELSQLAARGHATHLGDALQQVLATHRGRHVTDIVVLSDGRSNGGLPPLEAARAAAVAGIEVHTVVVGDTRPERNVLVELVDAPTNSLEGDEIAVIGRVSARGTASGQRTAVLLEELPPEGAEREPRLVAEQQVELVEAGERVVLFAPPGELDPRRRERRFRLSVPPVAGETLVDDNALEFSVHVTQEKIRVLYVDGYPRWEYRYLKNLLLRADQNLTVQCFLLSATADFVQESTRGTPALLEVPTDRRELLENYDVVILGDVSPYAVSPDPARCEEFLASLREFVERGGGLILQAGEYDNPRAFSRTPLEDVLPVQIDSTGALRFDGDTTREQRPVLEDPRAPHPIARLTPDLDLNRRLWEDEGGLRGFYWYAPVPRAKPGAQVLLRHPTEGGAHGRHPLLVTGYFPAGRTLFLATDSTWRWRYRYGDRYHERFWRNAIRWVALGRLKSGDRRIQLDSLRASYDLDERVTLEARVLDEDYRPSERPTQAARLEGPEGAVEDLSLALVPDRPGIYRSSLDVQRPGLYRAWIEGDGKRVASTEFEVVLPSRENADPAPDPETLASMARLTGGRHVDLSRVDELARAFPGSEERREPISSQLLDAWDNWATLLAALGLLSVEWILRKRLELV